jgi:hypothetical protein
VFEGVCLNEYYNAAAPTSVDGVWGTAYISSSYTDADVDGMGKPGTAQPWCTSESLGSRVSNNWDNDDSKACGSPEVDCAGNCKFNVGGAANPAYIGDQWNVNNICSAGCGGANCEGTLGCDECGLCNGFNNNGTMWGTTNLYPDVDGDGKGNPLGPISHACPATASAGTYVLLNTDTDDTCHDENYDSCGFCLDTDGNGTKDTNAMSNTMFTDCKGASWDPVECVSCDGTSNSGCITYNVTDHPGHNAMDCAGVCLNEYYNALAPTSVDGVWGTAYISSSYTDADGDGMGMPGTAQPWCTSESLGSRVSNNWDNDDGKACGSPEVDCAGNCKFNVGGAANTAYIGDQWNVNNICSAGCGTDYCDGTLGCDECGLCNGFGNNGTMWGPTNLYPDVAGHAWEIGPRGFPFPSPSTSG